MIYFSAALGVRERMAHALKVPQTTHTFEDGLRAKTHLAVPVPAATA